MSDYLYLDLILEIRGDYIFGPDSCHSQTKLFSGGSGRRD